MILKNEIKDLLDLLKAKNPQFLINGFRNMWIVKPGDMSRGRNISIFDNLIELLDFVDGKENQWIVQKYIENPLIVMNRKFDIRQWVLVTSLNPLTIWMYDEFYIRFGAEDWAIENFRNNYIHLTNNSIAKYSEHFDSSTIEGNMWTQEMFYQYVNGKYGNNVGETKIRKDIINIVKMTLESVQDSIVNRKNTVELYGYDFMVDENLNSWLIEINTSPAMDYSTKITEKLVKEVSEDLIKVIIDHKGAPKKMKNTISTGKFNCVYKSPVKIDKPKEAMGLILCCEGKPLVNKKKTQKYKSINTINIQLQN